MKFKIGDHVICKNTTNEFIYGSHGLIKEISKGRYNVIWYRLINKDGDTIKGRSRDFKIYMKKGKKHPLTKIFK